MIKKKKKTKMIKKKKLTILVTHNWGGHLHTPPKDCEKKDMWFTHNGIVWLDLSICHDCSIITECVRRKEYLKNINCTY